MATLTITRGTTLPNSSAKSDFHNLIDTATGSVSNIVNADIDSAAAISGNKLDLSSISQNLVMNGKIFKMAKGADVASVAGAITLGDDGNYFDITGTNAITSITAKTAGTMVVLQFDSTASLVDGSNLKLTGNFTGAAEAQICLISDGTNWFEVSRNLSETFTPSVSNALAGSMIQHLFTSTASVITTTNTIPNDDSIPQSGEGIEVLTQAITPNHASNKLRFRAVVVYDAPTSGSVECLALFQDATASALVCVSSNQASALGNGIMVLDWEMAAGTTSATTFKIRIGSSDNGTLTVNGEASARKYGGVLYATFSIDEVKV